MHSVEPNQNQIFLGYFFCFGYTLSSNRSSQSVSKKIRPIEQQLSTCARYLIPQDLVGSPFLGRLKILPLM